MKSTAKNCDFKEINFHIYDFMLKLDISPKVLSVYALIYSFTTGKRGLYYGSQEHLAKTLKISLRTVQRAYRTLFAMRLLERHTNEDGIKGLRAIAPTKIPKNPEKRKPVKEDMQDYEPITLEDAENKIAPQPEKYGLVEIEGCEEVTLTLRQYSKLRELVSSETLFAYIHRFKKHLDKCLDEFKPAPRNHYKTIKSWIDADFST